MSRVSVVMPVYNCEQFVREAVDSILVQTFWDFEFIIVDDGSTDRSAEIVNSFSDHRIQFIKNGENLGITKTLNAGLKTASGEFICRMDADDISSPNRLAEQVAFLDRHPECAIVGSRSILIDSNGKEIGYEGDSYPVVGLVKFIRNPFIHSSVIVRASAVRSAGMYDETKMHNEDYDLWLKILKSSGGAVVPDYFIRRRIHPGSITSSKELELIRHRIGTLFSAVFFEYKNPFLALFLFRPVLSFCYRWLKNIVR